MPQIKNKRKSRYVTLGRDVLADKRLKPTPKLLYGLLCSLSESCENVFSSYEWLAEGIGYDTEGKGEKALYMYISRNLEPLIKLGLINVVRDKDGGYDYEVFDYFPENLESQNLKTSNKNVTESHKNVTDQSQKCDPVIIEKAELSKQNIVKEKRKENFQAKNYIENLNLEPELTQAMLDWLEIRRAKRTPTTQRAIDLGLSTLQKLSNGDLNQKIKIINQTVERGWTGFFEVKNNTQNSPPPNKTQKFGSDRYSHIQPTIVNFEIV